MIDVKEAVKKAAEYLAEMFPNYSHELRLEEVIKEPTGWAVTMSLPRPGLPIFAGQRDYKRVVMGSEGGFERMEIRSLAS